MQWATRRVWAISSRSRQRKRTLWEKVQLGALSILVKLYVRWWA